MRFLAAARSRQALSASLCAGRQRFRDCSARGRLDVPDLERSAGEQRGEPPPLLQESGPFPRAGPLNSLRRGAPALSPRGSWRRALLELISSLLRLTRGIRFPRPAIILIAVTGAAGGLAGTAM